MSNQRVTCPRHHLLFEIVAEGISIKCRAGECRQVYVIPWAELDAKRQETGKCDSVEEKEEIAR